VNDGFDPATIEATLVGRMVGEFRQLDLACARAFRHDLENLLCLLDVGAGDRVFLPTAHYREAFAIRQLIHDVGAERSPHFHLELRHDVAVTGADLDEANDFITGYTKLGQVYLDAVRGYPDTDRLHFWTDTEELARDYQFHFGYSFGVLPIPFTHDLVAPADGPAVPPLNCLYIGDVREEKGFHRIPGLMRSLAESGALGRMVRFLIQATDIHPSAATPAVRAAMAELEAAPPAHVELVGRGQRFLPRAEYYRLLARADIVLCLYDAKIYRACSSGILAEALAAGKLVVVPADTWLARQLPQGCGEQFVDTESLAAAVVRIAYDYDAYRQRVNECRSAWLSTHSPSALVKQLIDSCRDQSMEALRRAA
jgi:glycosyltransferase involved in cell wall biosynthesis